MFLWPMRSSLQLNELGALRLQNMSRDLFEKLSEAVSRGSLRPKFARWQQVLAIWSLEKLPDVYTLRLHGPVIPGSELKALLRCRSDFNPLGIDGIAVERVNCVVNSL